MSLIDTLSDQNESVWPVGSITTQPTIVVGDQPLRGTPRYTSDDYHAVAKRWKSQGPLTDQQVAEMRAQLEAGAARVAALESQLSQVSKCLLVAIKSGQVR